MLIPIGDDDRKLSGPAYVTGALLLLNIGVFVLQTQQPDLVYRLSVIPYQITQGEDLVNQVPLDHRATSPEELPQRRGPSPIHLTLLTSMFLHGGWLHLGGNMLYLWIFGDNVEHRFGHGVFLGLYLMSGLVGSLVEIVLAPDSLIPMLGASGAIFGVLGAYLVLFPRNRVHAIFFVFVISIPAALAIGFWILFQFVAVAEMFAGGIPGMGGIAYMAHVAGFFAGVLLAAILRFVIKDEEHRSRLSRSIDSDPRAGRWW